MTGKRILVVDDDLLVLKLVKTSLYRGGYEVLTASDGHEGFEATLGEHPDLIITDIMMPVMDGFELARRVRSDAMVSSTPLIMLSAKSEDEDKIKGLELGADDYITKPFSPRDLLARVEAQLLSREMARNRTTSSPEGPFIEEGFKYFSNLLFENFVTGTSNLAAYESARASAINPGLKYNPLFIYGEPGLGKTHLMCALANDAFSRNNRIRALYLTSETFGQQVIEAVDAGEVETLHRTYHANDIFIIDDIQFIAVSPTLQSVGSSILSGLYDAGKQIVISSDRRPDELASISSSISAELAYGRIVRLAPPDARLRSRILHAKAGDYRWDVAPPILDYLAERLPSDIRMLTGIAARLVAMQSLSGIEPSEALVDQLVAEVYTEDARPETPEAGELPSREVSASSEAISAGPGISSERGDFHVPEIQETDEAAISSIIAADIDDGEDGAGRLPDPLSAEFASNRTIKRIHGDSDGIARILPERSVRPIVVLGPAGALVLDTVEAVVGHEESPPLLPQDEQWTFMIHASEDPKWVGLGVEKWDTGSLLAHAIMEHTNPVFIVVLDSHSPQIIEARNIVQAVPAGSCAAVAVLVSADGERLAGARRTLGKSLRRLFRVPEHIPIAIAPSVNTMDARNWVRMATE